MASFAETGPSAPVVESIRVDKVSPGARAGLNLRLAVAIVITVIMLIPVAWMAMTAMKSRPDATAAPPKVIFTPSLDSFLSLFTQRRLLMPAEVEQFKLRTDLTWLDKLALERGLA